MYYYVDVNTKIELTFYEKECRVIFRDKESMLAWKRKFRKNKNSDLITIKKTGKCDFNDDGVLVDL